MCIRYCILTYIYPMHHGSVVAKLTSDYHGEGSAGKKTEVKSACY